MLLDKQNLLSDAQQVVGAAGNFLSTNTIDLRATGTTSQGAAVIADFGRGQDVQVLAQVVSAFAGGTSVEAQLVMADDAALTSNLTVLQSTGAIATASLVPGYQFRLAAVPHGITKRYLGLRYVTLGVFAAAGSSECRITAGLVLDRQSNPSV